MTRPVLAEALGTSMLLYVIVGSGIAAEMLTNDTGLQLMAHALAVGAGLGALIAMMQTVSGSHFNPAVTVAFWRVKSIDGVEVVRYATAQISGAIVGVVGANWSFGEAMVSISTTSRGGIGLVVAEGIATFVLVLLILALVRTDRSGAVPAAVGAWIACVVFATASTGFANPAVTLARVFTDTYTGIAPAFVPGFLVSQTVAGLLAASAAMIFYPEPTHEQSRV